MGMPMRVDDANLQYNPRLSVEQQPGAVQDELIAEQLALIFGRDGLHYLCTLTGCMSGTPWENIMARAMRFWGKP